jgi:hypothetical protein
MNVQKGAWFVLRASVRDWWDDWVNWMLLGLVWVLCWLTIILGPPATFALVYAASYSQHEGQVASLRELAREAWKNAALSWLWMLINVVVLLIFWVDLNFALSDTTILQGIYLGLLVLLLFLWWCTQFFMVPFFFEFEKPNLWKALKNGILMTLAAPLYALVICGIGLVVMALSFVFVAPLLLGGMGLIALLGVRAVNERLVTFGVRKPEELDKE